MQASITLYRDGSRTKRIKPADYHSAPGIISRQKLTAKILQEPHVEFNRTIKSSFDGFECATKFWDMDEISIIEHAYALYLDRANKPICWVQLSIGGMAGTFIDTKVVMSHALLCAAHAVILYHNHPSGNLTPSQPDRDMTHKIVAAGKLLDITVLDHLIVSANGTYLSFADEGLI